MSAVGYGYRPHYSHVKVDATQMNESQKMTAGQVAKAVAGTFLLLIGIGGIAAACIFCPPLFILGLPFILAGILVIGTVDKPKE